MNNNVIYIIIAFMSSCGVSFSRPDATDAIIENIIGYVEEFIAWRNDNISESIDVSEFENIILTNTTVNKSGHYELNQDAASELSEFVAWLRDIKGWEASSTIKIAGESMTYVKCYINGVYTHAASPVVENIEPEISSVYGFTALSDTGPLKAKVIKPGLMMPVGTVIKSLSTPNSTNYYYDYYIDDKWEVRSSSGSLETGSDAKTSCTAFGYTISDIIGVGIIPGISEGAYWNTGGYVSLCYYLSDGYVIASTNMIGGYEGSYEIDTNATITVSKSGISEPNMPSWTQDTRLVINTNDARGHTLDELGNSIDSSIVKGTLKSKTQFAKIEYIVQRSSLVALADAIRAKTGNSESLTLQQMADDVASIQIGTTDNLVYNIAGTLTEYSNDLVTKIRDYAFYQCSGLTSVSFPSCKSIGYSAFYYCTSLKNVSFPTCTSISSGAFYGCGSLASINFPACTSIGSSAFANCGKLVSAEFPVCTRVENSAFANCPKLNQISFPTCSSIGSYAFASCVSLDNVYLPSIKTINTNTFANCSFLTHVDFPNCTTIGSSAFYSCSRLTDMSFPACTSIGSNAFNSCSYLVSVNFPSCTLISTSAFCNCYKLSDISFPVCTSIYQSAFYNCSSLAQVDFPACTNLRDYAFANCSKLVSASFPVCTSIGSYAFVSCSRLTSIYAPSCISIWNGAFQSCTRLVSVDFPACTYISMYAFRSCTSLTNVSVPACISIGQSAFQNCAKLTSVSFPSCSIIYTYAFASCYNLSTIILAGSSMCALSNSNAFNSTPYKGYSTSFSGTPYIYVPSSLVASYKVANNWKYFSSYFSAIEDMPTE